MNDPDRAARARDIIAVYETALKSPVLPLPFTGPDRSAFYLIDGGPETARENITAAKQVFAAAFGVTFGWHDEWASNGARRLYTARLASGLAIVLYTVAAHMQDEDAAEDAGELVAA